MHACGLADDVFVRSFTICVSLDVDEGEGGVCFVPRPNTSFFLLAGDHFDEKGGRRTMKNGMRRSTRPKTLRNDAFPTIGMA
jgi:hypothetical protein